MPNALVSLLDVSKRTGNDQAVGLLEDTLTYSPELSAIMGRPIVGTQYKTAHRALPTIAFRQANNGSNTVKSTYRQELKECALLDAQIQADKAVVDAEGTGSGPQSSIGDLLVDEAVGVIMGAYITVGTQVYYGTGADTNGFVGINTVTGASNAAKNANPAVVKAGGSTANAQTSVYLIWENIKGSHFVFGGKDGGQGLTMLPEWRIQQVLGQNGLPLTAYVNNLQGWLGFSINHPNSVARIANINLATDTSGLNDNLVSQILSYIPLQMRSEILSNLNTGGPNKWGPGLKLLMNPAAAYALQVSRTKVTGVDGEVVDKAAPQPAFPTSSNGIPIVLTDSITNTEAVIA
jgi:hypothetical protein